MATDIGVSPKEGRQAVKAPIVIMKGEGLSFRPSDAASTWRCSAPADGIKDLKDNFPIFYLETSPISKKVRTTQFIFATGACTMAIEEKKSQPNPAQNRYLRLVIAAPVYSKSVKNVRFMSKGLANYFI